MRLQGKKIAYLVEEGFEDLEFWVPRMRLEEEGAEITVVGTSGNTTYHSKHGCLTATSDLAASETSADNFDGVVVPGGWAPDRLRRNEGVKLLVRNADEAGKVIGMICHAGHVGVSAGIVDGHKATGSTAIKDDIENAGGSWVDEPAFRDGNQVWGRVVADIPAFCRELVSALEQS